LKKKKKKEVRQEMLLAYNYYNIILI